MDRWLHLFLLLCNIKLLQGQQLISNTPRNGPISGGTLIQVHGDDFITTGSSRSKCRFQEPGRGSVLSTENTIHNSSYMTCELPQIRFLPQSLLQGGHRIQMTITAGIGRSSNALPFLVYDLNSMHINEVSPREGLANVSNIILHISSSGVLDTSELTCSFEGMRRSSLVPAAFINSSVLQCRLLPHAETRVVRVEVSLNGQAAANIPAVDTSFTYYSTAPELISCQFTPSYALLLLKFDREVEIGGENRTSGDVMSPSNQLNCEMIFSDESIVNVIGRDAQCFWHNSQQREVVIRLNSNTRIQLGSVVILRNNSVRTRYFQYSRLASGSIAVGSILNPQVFKPAVVLEAPSLIPICGNFSISGSKSQYGGTRDLEFKWLVGSELDNSGQVVPELLLESYVPTGFTSQATLDIPSEVFKDNGMSGSGSGIVPQLFLNYTIQLTVRNFLGVTSTAVITRMEQTSPLNVIIIGGSMRHVRASSENLFQGIVTRDKDCVLRNVTAFRWRVRNVEDDTDVSLDSYVNSNSSVLVLPPKTLDQLSSYVATLTVDFDNGDVVTASVSIETEIEVVASIRGGIRRTLSADSPLYLDGSFSKGLTSLPSNATLQVTWSCMNVLTNDSCEDNGGRMLSLPTNEPAYTIESGVLSPGLEYNFTLTLRVNYQNLMLESTAYQVVVVLPHIAPTIEIFLSPGVDENSVLTHRELTLLADITSDLPGTVHWSSEYVIGYALLELSDDIVETPLQFSISPGEIIDSRQFAYSEDTPVLFTSAVSGIPESPFTNQISLVIKPDILLSQNTYRLKLSATNMLGHTGFADFEFQTESLPTSGRLEVAPSQGSPLETVFTISAPGWTDDLGDTPLLYQFGVRYTSTPTTTMCCVQNTGDACVREYWMTGITEQDEISTILPPPLLSVHLDSSNISQSQVVVRVYDNKGAYNEVTRDLNGLLDHMIIIEVDDNSTESLQPLSNEFDVFVLLDNIRSMSLHRGQWVEGLAYISAVVASVDTEQCVNLNVPCLILSNEDIGMFQSTTIDLLLDIYNSYIPSSKSFLNIVLTLLHEITLYSNVFHTDSRIVDFLERTTDIFNVFEREGDFSNGGLSVNESQMIIDIYQHIILSNSEFEDSAADVSAPSSSVVRVRENMYTLSLLSTTPNIGYGLCLQQAISERSILIQSSDNSTVLKSQWINLPSNYDNGGSVTVDFGSELFKQYLQWQCVTNSTSSGRVSHCSGVCLSSVEFEQDLTWQGSSFLSHTKTPLLQLFLMNPTTSEELSQLLTVQKRQAEQQLPSILITFSKVVTFSNSSNLECVHWDGSSKEWRGGSCSVEAVIARGSTYSVECRCNQFSGLIVTVVERCASGFYGNTCTNVCPHGLWGVECRQSCDCSNRGLCSPVDGSCDCDPGWMGTSCEDPCVTGTWGDMCREVCLCQNGASCDSVNGGCGCTPGWIGTYCNITCSDGFYGDGCASTCQCRDNDECDKITGSCTCQAGFTGRTCHETCQTGFYGLGCSSQCQCITNGTRSCDHITGMCDCLDSWMGVLCEIEITTPTIVVTTPVAVQSFEIWWAIVPLVVVTAIVAIITIVLIILLIRKKKRTKVLPISEHVDNGGTSVRQEVALSVSGSEDSEPLELTRTQSLDVLIPKGKTLKDVFSQGKSGGEKNPWSEFKEPDVMNGRLRWQIVRLCKVERTENTLATAKDEPKKEKTTNQMQDAGEDLEHDTSAELNDSQYLGSGFDDDHVTEVIYKRGVYLTSEAMLRDLRNSFIDSEQLDKKDCYFQFLRSDVPGDVIEIDTEDEIMLSQIEMSLLQHRTLYIESIDPSNALAELCVCGKYASMECSQCEKRGYCSAECQQGDWLKHKDNCKSKRRRKKSKKHHKIQKSSSSRRTPVGMLWPNVDTCICGKEAEFECSKCGKQGYCSEDCQLEDWSFHEYYCNQPGSQATMELEEPHKENRNKKLVTVHEESEEETAHITSN